MKVIGYVDGMNFYEASKDKNWYPAGWCNWTETIRSYFPDAEIMVRYFTTRLEGGNKARRQRQLLHLRAMEETAKAEIVYGKQALRKLRCQKCGEPIRCQVCGVATRVAEKQTDVNISIRLLEDAIDRKFDLAILVSADADIIPALQAALRRNVRAKVAVLRPPDDGRSPTDPFTDFETEYRGRAAVVDIDVKTLIRFPDDLAAQWGLPFPRHWRANAGKRPINPERELFVGTGRQRQPRWVLESMALSLPPKSRR